LGAKTLADTFDVLRLRSQAIRARSDRVDWCSISVEVEGPLDQAPGYSAVVRVDGGVAADLVGNEPRSFRVEPGEHTVVVRLRRQFWLHGCRERAVASLPLELQPGERVRLICGVRPEARAVAAQARLAELDLFQHVCIGSALAIAIGWTAYSAVNRLIDAAAEHLRMASYWVPFVQWLVGSRLATAVWGLVLWWLLFGQFSFERRRRRAASLKAEIVDPYFLKRVGDHEDGA
jgi:hypothetical protein